MPEKSIEELTEVVRAARVKWSEAKDTALTITNTHDATGHHMPDEAKAAWTKEEEAWLALMAAAKELDEASARAGLHAITGE